ncbi:hypothetical protein BDK51DRAFT_33072 [Blyttiomyces helicus]|uniref:Uncharacterized protein n=1 Tax=Blyttiomyces helicus TaxID=388810 RepID=A0A4P9WQ44_9FUNG|nr:hypothetical protein BDK51DRAFT_33072 [Blyttiomyces helicus]|eukprot:RKO94702.1 hypothetical protein BDK51DRAFT_33072 [Blyttiomyces helicus]
MPFVVGPFYKNTATFHPDVEKTSPLASNSKRLPDVIVEQPPLRISETTSTWFYDKHGRHWVATCHPALLVEFVAAINIGKLFLATSKHEIKKDRFLALLHPDNNNLDPLHTNPHFLFKPATVLNLTHPLRVRLHYVATGSLNSIKYMTLSDPPPPPIGARTLLNRSDQVVVPTLTTDAMARFLRAHEAYHRARHKPYVVPRFAAHRGDSGRVEGGSGGDDARLAGADGAEMEGHSGVGGNDGMIMDATGEVEVKGLFIVTGIDFPAIEEDPEADDGKCVEDAMLRSGWCVRNTSVDWVAGDMDVEEWGEEYFPDDVESGVVPVELVRIE